MGESPESWRIMLQEEWIFYAKCLLENLGRDHYDVPKQTEPEVMKHAVNWD